MRALVIALTFIAASAGAVRAEGGRPERGPSAGIPPRGSVADRIRATGFGAGIRPTLSDEYLVKRAEAIDAYFAQNVIDSLCTMATEVEYGMLERDTATRGIGRGKGNILADEPDKNIYATTLKAAMLAWVEPAQGGREARRLMRRRTRLGRPDEPAVSL